MLFRSFENVALKEMIEASVKFIQNNLVDILQKVIFSLSICIFWYFPTNIFD